jgi:hypothetical protein
MKFLPRVCDPSLFSRLPGTQFPVSMIHSDYAFIKLWIVNYQLINHEVANAGYIF